DGLPLVDDVALLDERLRARRRRPVEGSDERRDDRVPPVLRGLAVSRSRRQGSRSRRGRRRHRGNRRARGHGPVDLDLRALSLDGEALDGASLEAFDQVTRFLPDRPDEVLVGARRRLGFAHSVSPRGERVGCRPGIPNFRNRSYRCSTSWSRGTPSSSLRVLTIAAFTFIAAAGGGGGVGAPPSGWSTGASRIPRRRGSPPVTGSASAARGACAASLKRIVDAPSGVITEK